MSNDIIDWYPKLIYKFNYDFSNIPTELIINKLSFDCIDLQRGNALSSVHKNPHPHQLEENKCFVFWMLDKCKNIFDIWEYDYKDVVVSNSWCNIHKKSGETKEHNHGMSNLSVVSYLKKPQNSGEILFRDPLDIYKSMEPSRNISNPWRKLITKENDVLFFPGWLYHKVEKNNSNQDRIVMTYNIQITT